MVVVKEGGVGSKTFKDIFVKDATELGRYLILKFKLGSTNPSDSQTPHTVGRVCLDYAKTSSKLSNKRVDQLITKDLILRLLKGEKSVYTDSALKTLGLKNKNKKKISIEDYNPSSNLKKAVSKFIKNPFAVAIVATWYENEGASPSDISLDDIEDMLDAATDSQEIEIVKAALK